MLGRSCALNRVDHRLKAGDDVLAGDGGLSRDDGVGRSAVLVASHRCGDPPRRLRHHGLEHRLR